MSGVYDVSGSKEGGLIRPKAGTETPSPQTLTILFCARSCRHFQFFTARRERTAFVRAGHVQPVPGRHPLPEDAHRIPTRPLARWPKGHDKWRASTLKDK